MYEILVEVEQTGICGTDVHEYKGDPFGYIPIELGHEGTGTIVKLGKKCDVGLLRKTACFGRQDRYWFKTLRDLKCLRRMPIFRAFSFCAAPDLTAF